MIGANAGPGCCRDLETQGNLLLTSVSEQKVLTKSFSQCDGKVFVSGTDIATSVLSPDWSEVKMCSYHKEPCEMLDPKMVHTC